MTDFKSCDPNVQHANTILDYVEDALDAQHSFRKNTTPCEINHWDYEDLQSFKVDVDKIDRLYHIFYHAEYHWETDFELIVRMQYDKKPLYVELIGNCCEINGFNHDGVGHIFVSRDVDIFMKCVLRNSLYERSKYNIKAIYELLKEDGIHFEARSCKNTPTLQQLCYKTICYNIAALPEYKTELPKMLTENINYFIKLKEAIKHYNKCRVSMYCSKTYEEFVNKQESMSPFLVF